MNHSHFWKYWRYIMWIQRGRDWNCGETRSIKSTIVSFQTLSIIIDKYWFHIQKHPGGPESEVVKYCFFSKNHRFAKAKTQFSDHKNSEIQTSEFGVFLDKCVFRLGETQFLLQTSSGMLSCPHRHFYISCSLDTVAFAKFLYVWMNLHCHILQ